MNTNFQAVVEMNRAFGNPGRQPGEAMPWSKIVNQSKNIVHEFGELLVAFGYNKAEVDKAIAGFDNLTIDKPINLAKVRDALADIHVFAYGAHHFMGIDADKDVQEVVSKVMTRFIVDDDDKQATIAMHAAKGVTDVYFEGEFPTMVMKSNSDQPDAPAGKFLKSASYMEPTFYKPDDFHPDDKSVL